MTVFVNKEQQTFSLVLALNDQVQEYVSWLEQHSSKCHNTRVAGFGDWDKQEKLEDKAKQLEVWGQMLDDFKCLHESKCKFADHQIMHLGLYHGSGWHVLHCQGFYVTGSLEHIYIPIYDENLALQFKLTFGL